MDIDLLIMFVAFASCFIGYAAAWANPFGFDTDEAHGVLICIMSAACALLGIGLYVLSL